MSIYRKVRAVEKVFKALDSKIAELQNASGLSCLKGCGKCCFKADIEASPLEFLPFAYQAFKEEKAMELYENLKSNPGNNLCSLLKPHLESGDKGYCSAYFQRGLICRGFGFTARKDKFGAAKLLTCQLIKQEQPLVVTRIESEFSFEQIPFLQDFYMALMVIDFRLAQERLPINMAIKIALEEVLAYYSYRGGRPPSKKPRKAA